MIDAHCHLVHGNAEHTRYRADEIVRTMDAAGVERTVVFAMSVSTAESIRLADEAVRAFPDRLIPYAYALPAFDGDVVGQLRAAIDRGFGGIKLHAAECPITERTHVPLMRLAEETGVPLLADVCGRLGQAEWMLSAFPRATVIVAHIGAYRCVKEALLDRFIALAETYANAVLDVSGVVLPWAIADAVRRVGADRVVWGSDGPHPLPDTASFLAGEIEKIRCLDLPASDIEALLGGAIQRILGRRGPLAP